MRSDITKKRFFDKISMAKFLNELANVESWSDIYNHCQLGADTDAAFNCFHKQYTAIFEKTFQRKQLNGVIA